MIRTTITTTTMKKQKHDGDDLETAVDLGYFCGAGPYSDHGYSCLNRLQFEMSEFHKTEEQTMRDIFQHCSLKDHLSPGAVPDEGDNDDDVDLSTWCGECMFNAIITCDKRVQIEVYEFGITLEDAKKANINKCSNAEGPSNGRSRMLHESINIEHILGFKYPSLFMN